MNDNACAPAAPLPANLLPLKGRLVIEHWREGEKIAEYNITNGITNEGKNRLFDVMFHGTSAHTTWYLGLIDNNNYGGTGVQATDKYDDIDQAGHDWDEFTGYSEANRVTWPEDAASGQSISNSAVATFTISSAGAVRGVFLCAGTNAATKGDHTAGTAHCLWATALFASTVTVAVSDQLKITYTVSA